MLGLVARSLVVTAEVLGPVLGLILAAGLAVSVAQAAMQLQDPTLTYVPRLAAAAAAVLAFGGWMLALLVHFAAQVFDLLPGAVPR